MTAGTSSPQRSTQFPGKYLLAFAAGVFGIYLILVSVYWASFGNLSGEHDRWGQLGDFLGGMMNPLIGIAGFAGLFLTLRQQQHLLEMQYAQIENDSVKYDLEHMEHAANQLALAKAEAAREKSEEERRTAEKVARLMDYVKQWDSPEFKAAQFALRSFLRDYSSANQLFVIETMKGSTDRIGETGKCLTLVYTFLSRIELLLRHDLVRFVDVDQMLGHDIREWVSRLSLLCFVDLPGTSAGLCEQVRNLETWYRQFVEPLAPRFQMTPQLSTR